MKFNNFTVVLPMSICLSAYEILGNPVKRRSYDSVDPQFDDSIPSVTPESRQNFYDMFSPVFEQNSRYSCAVYSRDYYWFCQFLSDCWNQQCL